MKLLPGILAMFAIPTAAPPREGGEVLGTPAPPLGSVRWIQGRAAEPDLRGKVALIRWWTSGCSLCSSTAPALNRLHADFAERGLVVAGVFHPKPRPRRVDPAHVRQVAREYGFRFHLGLDEHWAALRRWWLDAGDRSYTSVSFVVDRSGRIRYVHPGGEFFPSSRPEHAQQSRDYLEIRGLIEKLLAEAPPRG
jgi:peroxiredoxin